MAQLDPSVVIDQLEVLIAAYVDMQGRAEHDDLSDLPKYEMSELSNSNQSREFMRSSVTH
jgi:hypothetical protein